MTMQTQPRYLDTEEAAEVSRLSRSWLIKLRNYQPEKSPPFLKFGKRVLYPEDGLHTWMRGHAANGVSQ